MSEAKGGKGVKLKLKGGRLSFPSLFKKDKYDRYSASLIVEPGSEPDKQIKAAIKQAAINEWGDEAVKKLKAFALDKGSMCYRSGDAKGDISGYEGNMVLSMVNRQRPTLKDRAKGDIVEDGGELYSGCYPIAIVEIWPQNNAKGGYYGIRCQLLGLQQYKDGERFAGGKTASDDEFDDLSDEEDETTDSLLGGDDDDIPY